jgi:hypothetical protein
MDKGTNCPYINGILVLFLTRQTFRHLNPRRPRS